MVEASLKVGDLTEAAGDWMRLDLWEEGLDTSPLSSTDCLLVDRESARCDSWF